MLLHVALPQQVAEQFIRHPESYHQTARVAATIVFRDIRGFSTAVEGFGGRLEEVKAHLESVQAVRRLGDPHFKGIKVGGTSSADCLIGAFGTSKRLSYTVLGDAVNLASRLEPASAQVGAANLFCGDTARLTRDRRDILWRCVGELRVLGKDHTCRVHEALDPGETAERRWLEARHGRPQIVWVGASILRDRVSKSGSDARR